VLALKSDASFWKHLISKALREDSFGLDLFERIKEGEEAVV